MLHLDNGTLRRLLDEPRSTLASARAHFALCQECKRRADELDATARQVAQALDSIDQKHSEISLSQAMTRTRARIAAGESSNITQARRTNRYAAPLLGLAAAAAIVIAFIFTPLGTLAQGFLTIFEPRQFQPVAVTPMDRQNFRYLPPLEAYGTLRELARPQMRDVPGPAQAAALARMPLRVPPPVLPANISGVARWSVTSQGSAMFTFIAAKARMAAAAAHRPLPPMPPGLDGSTLQVTIGPIVAAAFGGEPARLKRELGRAHRNIRQNSQRDMSAADFPSLVILQAPVPRVLSTGVSVRQIEDYLLRQPGVPPSLASQIAAIGDPTTTLPIPVPIDRASAQQVIVQGVRGLAVGDNTGVGAGVVWQRDGFIYGVAGPLPESEVLAIANSLR